MNEYNSKTDLFLSIKNGNKSAYKEVVNEFYLRLYNYAYSITKDNEGAKDVVIIAFQNCWQAIQKIDNYDVFRKTLFTTAYHLSLNYIRTKKRLSERHAATIPFTEPSDNTILNSLYHKEVLGIVNEEIGKMDDMHQLIANYVLFDSLKPTVIAKLLDMKPQAVRNIKTSVLQKIRQCLSKYGYRVLLYLAMLNVLHPFQKKIKKQVFGELKILSAVSFLCKPYSNKYH